MSGLIAKMVSTGRVITFRCYVRADGCCQFLIRSCYIGAFRSIKAIDLPLWGTVYAIDASKGASQYKIRGLMPRC